MKLKVVGLAVVLGSLLRPGAASAQPGHGSLKVTSFPSGAHVIIDGTDTGKVTPMSVSVAIGEHTVTVTSPGPGWSPAERTVAILSGNNDLSVTLLPTLTVGPAGPQGDKGEKGDKGDPGGAAFAGQACPPGSFVTGFTLTGTLLCGQPPSGSGDNGFPIALPYAEAVRAYVQSLVGNELNRSEPFQYNIPSLGGALHGNLEVVGFALCEPTVLGAAPSAEPPLFDCVPNATVTFFATSASQATLTISLQKLYVRLGGSWTLDGPYASSGSINAYGLYSNVTMSFSVALTDAGGNQVQFGPSTSSGVQYQSSNLSGDFGSDVVTAAMRLVMPMVFSNIASAVGAGSAGLLAPVLAGIPPFTLH